MIGGQSLIDKYWVKFDGLNIICLCKVPNCLDSSTCKEYIVKLTEVERSVVNESVKQLEVTTNKVVDIVKKENNELKNSIKKLKGFKL